MKSSLFFGYTLVLLPALLGLPLASLAKDSQDQCPDLLPRLEAVTATKFKVSVPPQAPVGFHLSISRKEGDCYLQAAHESLRAGWPQENLLTGLRQSLESQAVPSEALMDSLDSLRGRLKTARFLCEALCEEHKSPAHLDELTVLIGKLADVHKFGHDPAAEMDALRALLEVMSPDYLGKVENDLKEMRADRKEGNSDWLEKSLKKISAALAAEKLSEKELHGARKIVGRIKTALLFDALVKDDQEKLANYAWIHRLYKELGEDHDEIVRKELSGQELGAVEFSAEVRSLLEQLVAGSR